MHRLFIAIAIALFVLSPVAQPRMVAAEGREHALSIFVNATAGEDFAARLELAKAAGVTRLPIYVDWRDAEPAPGEYLPDYADMGALLATEHMPVDLLISPNLAENLVMPEDLAALPFDDPRVIGRFLALMDAVDGQFTGAGVELHSLVIGNEIDSYLASDVEAWKAFTRFYQAAVAFSHARWPGVPVGVQTTYRSLVDAERGPRLEIVNASSDFISLTYYPTNDDFSMQSPAVFESDLEALMSRYPDKPLQFLEIGYASSELLGSSEARQAEFVHEVFRVWDAHPDAVWQMTFFSLTDFSEAEVAILLDAFQFDDPRFAAFIGTLGLRTSGNPGKPKLAYDALVKEAAKRSFETA